MTNTLSMPAHIFHFTSLVMVCLCVAMVAAATVMMSSTSTRFHFKINAIDSHIISIRRHLIERDFRISYDLHKTFDEFCMISIFVRFVRLMMESSAIRFYAETNISQTLYEFYVILGRRIISKWTISTRHWQSSTEMSHILECFVRANVSEMPCHLLPMIKL